ncbi:CHASE3 domain-containing protein [Pyxidicoccus parkwayensis]|uniref:histidine kinase n=1 Tax=Pyxidicoccus parkwayensis TaxID=2813578 RepID=A0ABX7NYH5_9BACT|nr:sensor histidine kinase [Pyxidicoccus parkwaysis]QSQ21128.1 CHASE3 domain-containing protein [Pyxidicoccus parkwaysis]
MAYLDPNRFRHLLIRSVALPAVLGTMLAVLLFWEVRQLLQADESADRSDAVLAQAVQVRQLFIDRETGLRGFLLTGDSQFLEPYYTAGEHLPDATHLLGSLVSDSPDQQARLVELRRRQAAWEAFADDELRSFKSGGNWLRPVVEGEGKRRMDGIRRLLDEMSSVERTRADQRGALAERQARMVLWGGAVWLLVLGVLLSWMGRRQLVVLSSDYESLLEKAQAQANALRASEARLEQRVAQRTQELTAANRELETFSYSVSHDLRAPLRAVDGFSQALLEDEGERISSEGHEHLRRLRAAATRMGQLIDDLLRLSRLSRAELRQEPVDLSALAREVAEGLKRGEPGRDTTFDIAPGLTTYGDARLLRVVLENLLGNAWKFTSQRSGARIEFFIESRDGHPHYCVRDNGVGFDMAYASKLFSPFQRLHHPSEFPGTGIGLATVQRIIHRHGGDISAEAVPDGGATFRFTVEASHP